jgi:hypothetical protein
MKSIITILLVLVGFFQVQAQMNFKKALADETNTEEVQILIVRNAEECLGYESYIYELIDGDRKKVALLYHESDNKKVATNYYNLNMIRDVLMEYSMEGYSISATSAENTSGRCNRQMTYTLVKTPEYQANK